MKLMKLKKKLSDIQNRRKEDQEIKKLKKHIKAENLAKQKQERCLIRSQILVKV